jgi:hypothetical protein
MHCAGIEVASITDPNAVIRYNVFENMLNLAGTAYIEVGNSGTGSTGYEIYGNVFHATDPNESTGLAIICTTGSDIVHGVLIYNNTFYGLHGACGVYFGGVGSTGTAANNVWQDCVNAPGFTGCTDTTNEKNTGLASFVNAAGGNFHLAAETNAGTNLGASYNLDPDGVIRGAGAVWDLGAYEYVDPAYGPYMRVY